MSKTNKPLVQIELIIALFLLAFFFALGTASVRWRSLTYDEPNHFKYGMNILNGDSTRFDDSKMPLSAWNAIPGKVVSYLPPENIIKIWLKKHQIARLMTLIFSMGIALLVWHWSRKLYGIIPALFSLFLYVLDPNIIAHSQLITTDVYAMGTTTIVFYCLWCFAHQRNWLNGLIFSFALGLSLTAKYTAIVLFPLSIISIVLFDLPSLREDYQANSAGVIKKIIYRYAGYIAIASLISILVINVAFLFNHTFTHLGDYKFRSDMFQAFQVRLHLLKNLPIPTPYPFLEGLDWVMKNEQTGASYGSIYMLGTLKPEGQGFLGYYLIASLIKVPITSQVIILLSIIYYVKDKKRRANFLQDEQFLLIPVIFYTVYFNFFYNAQIGIRYFLIVFPFLYVFAGNLFVHWDNFSKWQKSLCLLLGGYLVISVFSYYPYYITYFNELVLDKKSTYKYLADSNLDWGQDRYQLDAYLEEHPDALTEVDHPQAGHFIIRANILTGVALGNNSDPEQYEWLRNNFAPVDILANYYFVFIISPEEIEQLCRTTNYCK